MTSITALLREHFDAELLFSDTGSFTYEIKSKDLYEEFFRCRHLFAFSNYRKDSTFLGQGNKKVTDKMEDESEGKIID